MTPPWCDDCAHMTFDARRTQTEGHIPREIRQGIGRTALRSGRGLHSVTQSVEATFDNNMVDSDGWQPEPAIISSSFQFDPSEGNSFMTDIIIESFQTLGMWLYPMTALAIIGLLWIGAKVIMVQFGAPFSDRKPLHLPRVFWILVPVAIGVIASLGVGIIFMEAVATVEGATWERVAMTVTMAVEQGLDLVFYAGLYCAVLAGLAVLAMGLVAVLQGRPIFENNRNGWMRLAAGCTCFAITALVALVILQLGVIVGDDYGMRMTSKVLLILSIMAGGAGCSLVALSKTESGTASEAGRGTARFTAAVTYLFSLGAATVAAAASHGYLVVDAAIVASVTHKERVFGGGLETMQGIVQVGLVATIVTAVVVVAALVASGGLRGREKLFVDVGLMAAAGVVLLAAMAFAFMGWLEFAPHLDSIFGETAVEFYEQEKGPVPEPGW